MLISRTDSLLLVVDVQAKLLPTIHEAEAVKARVLWLARAAAMLGVPRLATEQYPQGLGPTDTEVVAALGEVPVVGKVTFSCAAGQCFDEGAAPSQKQIVVCGIEAHVCVLQTALDLAARGREVFVVADAIGSRKAVDKALAIERLRGAGVQIVSSEMVGFEWLRAAGSEEFRAFSKAFLRG